MSRLDCRGQRRGEQNGQSPLDNAAFLQARILRLRPVGARQTAGRDEEGRASCSPFGTGGNELEDAPEPGQRFLVAANARRARTRPAGLGQVA